MKRLLPLTLLSLSATLTALAASDVLPLVRDEVAKDYPSLESLYQDLHLHPELSLQEKKTSAKLAEQLRAAGFDVTESFGGTGVVAVLKNGAGPVVLVRSDMDALPVHEETGLPYASTVHMTDLSGKDVPVMHACGHDIHMTILTGTARALVSIKDKWSGTLILIGQPAEEMGLGARAMLTAGLFTKFPTPTFAVALHDNASLPAGTVGFVEGFATANANSVDIVIHGQGGHGSAPDLTKDPIVLAAKIVLALQTIVSREIHPGDPAVLTVGSIHGGTTHNIIPNEVKLQLTLRSYSEDVRLHLIASIRRICQGEAIAAGIPDELMPTVTVIDGFTPSSYNDPALTKRVRASVTRALGSDAIREASPSMVAEDFAQYSRTLDHIPGCMFWIGAVAPEKVAESKRTGINLPSLHSSKFAPLPEPTIKTGIVAMSAAVLDLLATK